MLIEPVRVGFSRTSDRQVHGLGTGNVPGVSVHLAAYADSQIWLVNGALSYSFLKLERRQAIVLGAIMGFFTAPWILPALPYVFDWTI